MGSPFGKKQVPGSVSAEINLRAGKAGSLWNAKRFPWIELTSLCSGCPGQFGVLSSTKGNLYESNYIRPLPVITGVDVKKQGELGTTRRATVKLTAYSDEQLVELQKCYFIPGMGCRVEWGWSQDASGKKAPSTLGSKTLTDAQAICQMNSLASSNTHYSGIQGMVANFGYSLTRDNTWECTIEIIAASEALGGTKVNEHSCECGREYENEENGEKKKAVENRSQLYVFFKDLFESYDTAAGKYSGGLSSVAAIDGKSIHIAQFNYMGVSRTESGGDDSSWYEGGVVGAVIGNQPDATEAYISWSTLEAAINRYCIPSAGGKYTLGRISSEKMKISYHPKLESSDPRVCIVPGTSKATSIAQHMKGTYASAIVGDAVLLDNIMVNTIMLMKELKSVEEGDGTLKTFVANVLRKINDACGSLWEFEVTSTTEDCTKKGTEPVISVIDAKIYEAAAPFQLPALAIGDRASVLRDMTLEMKMTDQMKTQALYSNGTQQKSKTTSGGNCGSNGFQPFGLSGKGTFKSLSMPKAKTPPPCDCKGAAPNEKKPSFDELFEAMKEEVNDSTTSAARTALMEAYGNSVNSGDDNHCKGMPMPFEFNFTLDGIGGFAFGQIVSCDRIPSSIRNAFDWQVTAVEHSITPNDWTTTVNTVCRYK